MGLVSYLAGFAICKAFVRPFDKMSLQGAGPLDPPKIKDQRSTRGKTTETKAVVTVIRPDHAAIGGTQVPRDIVPASAPIDTVGRAFIQISNPFPNIAGHVTKALICVSFSLAAN